MKLNHMIAGGAAALGLMLATPGIAGVHSWTEVGDAGQNGPAAAQVPFGPGMLDTIIGELSDGDDVDVYQILITDFENFSATTILVSAFDTQLFLFNADGTGQVANDDFGGTFQSTITSQGVFANGLYYIAISRFNADPLDGSGDTIFNARFWPGPDEQQYSPTPGTGAFASWQSGNGPLAGDYCILLTGATFVPTPGAAVALLMAGMVGRRSRRR